MLLVDTHCHLFDIKNYSLPKEIVPVVVGYSHRSNRKVLSYAREPFHFPIVLGIAPQTVLREGITKVDEWVEFIRNHQPNAIGEIGLDYKWAQNKKDVEYQIEVFEIMLSLARELAIPVVIHSRNNPNQNEVPKDAIDEILKRINRIKFLMHFYSGSETQAKKIVDMGGYISVIPLHSKERRKVIESVPLERLVVESDSPYVGRTPEVIYEAINYISEIKTIDYDKVVQATTENAMKIFDFEV